MSADFEGLLEKCVSLVVVLLIKINSALVVVSLQKRRIGLQQLIKNHQRFVLSFAVDQGYTLVVHDASVFRVDFQSLPYIYSNTRSSSLRASSPRPRLSRATALLFRAFSESYFSLNALSKLATASLN